MAKKKVLELLLSGAVLALTAAMFLAAVQKSWEESTFLAVFYAVGCLLTLVLGAACLDMASLQPADSHSLYSLIMQYALNRSRAGPLGWRAKHKFDAVLNDCAGTQEKTLRRIIQQNKGTAYGLDHNLSSICTRQDLVRLHPLTTYAAYESYTERIARGERNVMTKDDVIMMGLTSGTTGKNKKYPIADSFPPGLIRALWSTSQRNQRSRDGALQRTFSFRVFHPLGTNEHGIKEGGVGNLLAKPRGFNITPGCFMKTSIEGPSFYIQAVFTLSEKEIGRMDGYSSDSWYSFFKFIVRNRDQLCDAIGKGELSAFPKLPEELRCEVTQYLRPNPERAREVREILQGPTLGMVQKLWPNLSCIFGASSGGFAHSAKLLRDTFTGDLPLYYLLHAATEGILGVSYDPPLEKQEYTCLTEIVVMEFIPVENMEDDYPVTLFPEQVEVGRSYELVVTNMNGLYRNRFGDVAEITGFSGKTPKYKLLYRSGQILNIALDRTPDNMLFDALERTGRSWPGLEIVNYTSTESMQLEAISGNLGVPGMYVIFIEVLADGKRAEIPTDMENKLDDALQSLHSTYKEFRDLDSVGRLKIIQVESGTFDGLRNLLTNDKAAFQFKMPRVLRKQDALDFLWQHKTDAQSE